MALVSIAEYAAKHGKEQSTVKQKAARGGFTTAVKIGRNWAIDENEPYADLRHSETRPPKKLDMKTIFTADAYAALTASERRRILKYEQAAEYSGWRAYPATCEAIMARIPAAWWSKYSAQHIGDIAALLKVAYDDGRASNPGPTD